MCICIYIYIYTYMYVNLYNVTCIHRYVHLYNVTCIHRRNVYIISSEWDEIMCICWYFHRYTNGWNQNIQSQNTTVSGFAKTSCHRMSIPVFWRSFPTEEPYDLVANRLILKVRLTKWQVSNLYQKCTITFLKHGPMDWDCSFIDLKVLGESLLMSRTSQLVWQIGSQNHNNSIEVCRKRKRKFPSCLQDGEDPQIALSLLVNFCTRGLWLSGQFAGNDLRDELRVSIIGCLIFLGHFLQKSHVSECFN